MGGNQQIVMTTCVGYAGNLCLSVSVWFCIIKGAAVCSDSLSKMHRGIARAKATEAEFGSNHTCVHRSPLNDFSMCFSTILRFALIRYNDSICRQFEDAMRQIVKFSDFLRSFRAFWLKIQ